jgi:hypothetical protein
VAAQHQLFGRGFFDLGGADAMESTDVVNATWIVGAAEEKRAGEQEVAHRILLAGFCSVAVPALDNRWLRGAASPQ